MDRHVVRTVGPHFGTVGLFLCLLVFSVYQSSLFISLCPHISILDVFMPVILHTFLTLIAQDGWVPCISRRGLTTGIVWCEVDRCLPSGFSYEGVFCFSHLRYFWPPVYACCGIPQFGSCQIAVFLRRECACGGYEGAARFCF